MIPVDFIPAINFAEAESAHRLVFRNSFFYILVQKIVVPHNRGVSAQNIPIIHIIRVRAASGRMIDRKIEQIEAYARRHDFGSLDYIQILEIRAFEYPTHDFGNRIPLHPRKIRHIHESFHTQTVRIRSFLELGYQHFLFKHIN